MSPLKALGAVAMATGAIAQGITSPKLLVSCQIDFAQPVGTTTLSGHLTAGN